MKFAALSQRRRCGLRAFTLIELLVVISILALLIALSLPALGRAKARALTATCSTKVHGLGQAMRTYLADFDGTFPLNGLIMPKSSVPTMYATAEPQNLRFQKAEIPVSDKERWRPEFGALWPYMGGSSLGPVPTPAPPLPPMTENMAKRYLCQVDAPTFLRTYSDNQTWGNGAITMQPNASGGEVITLGPGAPGYWSYSINSVANSLGRFRNRFNAGLLPWSDPLKEVNVKTAQNFILFVEEDNGSLFNDEVFDAPAYSQGDLLTNRHQKGGNVGFLDGHVEQFNQTLFNEVPSGIAGSFVSHPEAMASPITRMFFPDGGNFATGY